MLLNVHTYYSLRYGTYSPETLLPSLRDNGYDIAVITDINNSSGLFNCIKECGKEKLPLQLLAGMEYRNGDELLYIGIAKNTCGFRELNELATYTNQTRQPFPLRAPVLSDVFVIYPMGRVQAGELGEHEYIGVRPSELNRIRMSPDLHKYVILAPVSFPADQYKLHRQLRAIDHNLLISQLSPAQVASPNEILVPRDTLLSYYKDFPELIRNTEYLLSQCSFQFDFEGVKNKKHFTGDAYADGELLYRYTMEGFRQRYPADDATARERIQKELDIINKQNFASYFLITDDICRYARSKNFHYVGRGSGANSIVAYCLGITDVDPVVLDLYFERFLNPKRKTSPDFDIDFCWNERDQVYQYIFEKYPAGHVALMGTMSTFHQRSIKRELAKIYGLPKADIDRLVDDPEHMLNKNEITDMILSVCDQIANFPNQRSIHASGVLISEQPLSYYTALDYPPKSLPVTQFDMYTAEDIHFEKFDILSQRGIGHIRDCRELVRRNRGEVISTDLLHRFFTDPEIAANLRSANTIGCFYIESPAMRQLLYKLQCDNYPTLVAASSIIRPGVASSGMMQAYIERHHYPERVTYPHPVFQEHLGDTYGIMVYQEDVMKIAHYYGGLDLADADVLRRMMSGKFKHQKELQEIKTRFFNNCKEKGYPEPASIAIWEQMESFAGFSFNKAHSASFAVESYQSLYLKTYYPIEFMVAVLNNYGGFYPRKVYINETRRSGGNICLPCVNKSLFNTIIYGKEVYLGFDCLQHMEARFASLIIKVREEHGDYTSLENFIIRTGAGLEQVVLLIRIGAFRFTGIGKKELLWEAHLILSRHTPVLQHIPLFEQEHARPALPPLATSVLEDLYDEMELLGFTVSGSAFELARSPYRGNVKANELAQYEGITVRIVGDFIADKSVKTSTGKHMKFGTFIDEEGTYFDTAHFSPSLAQYPLRGPGLYLLEGTVTLDFGCPSIHITKCGKMPLKKDPRSE